MGTVAEDTGLTETVVAKYRKILIEHWPNKPVNLLINDAQPPGFLLVIDTEDDLKLAREVFPDDIDGFPIYYRMTLPKKLHEELPCSPTTQD